MGRRDCRFESDHPDVKIIGAPTSSYERMEANFASVSGGRAGGLWRTEMAPALWTQAVSHGIDPLVMVAQSAKETAWGNFTGNVKPWFYNTCGLKIRNTNEFDCAKGDLPMAHATFASWDAGACAQAQHLLAYCGRPLNPGEILLDTRWVWVYGKHEAVEVEDLGGKWAPAAAYGADIATMAKKLAA